MSQKKYIILLFFLSFGFHFSQTISGKVINEKGEPIFSANILFKESQKPDLVVEFCQTNKQGAFTYKLKKEYPKLLVEITALGYQSQQQEIENYHTLVEPLLFVLEKSTQALKTVVVKSYKIKEKNDTVFYNPKAFADGTERKVEDILKKLPGIEVNEKSGQISYKGKPVETVNLDGDNLFGYNYQLGTRNINVDMVEQVQAIENYSENPLLKNIENSNKVALNLKIKKGKTDYSGNAELGLGYKDVYNSSFNLLSVSQKLKGFFTSSYNNIGHNYTSFDYNDFSLNQEQINEQTQNAKKIISETTSSGVLDAERTTVNNAWFNNLSFLYKIHQKVSFKTNLYYYKDIFSSDNYYQTQYAVNDESFTNTDWYKNEKKPELLRADFEMKWVVSKNALLQYSGKVSTENIRTQTNLLSDVTENYQTKLLSENFIFRNKLLFTQKLNDKQAFQAQLFFSKNDIPQQYSLLPSLHFISDFTEITQQKSNFTKNYAEAKVDFLGSSKLGKYVISIGIQYEDIPYNSLLTEDNQSVGNNYENNLCYYKSNGFLETSFTYKKGKWQLQPSISIKNNTQAFKDFITNSTLSATDIIFAPAFSAIYKLSRKSVFNASVSYDKIPIEDEYLLPNFVLTSNRNLQKSSVDLAFQELKTTSLSYSYNDNYNFFTLLFSGNYSETDNDFFSRYSFSETLNNTFYFRMPYGNKNLMFFLKTDKYIPWLQSTLRISANYSNFLYKNIVNDSELRNNKAANYSGEFFWKTALDIPINFQNEIKVAQADFYTENIKINSNTSFNYTSSIIARFKKRITAVFSADYFLPDTQKRNEDYWFLDAKFDFFFSKSKYNFSIIVKNLLNNTTFSQRFVSDYSTSLYQTNLLNRYILLSFNINF